MRAQLLEQALLLAGVRLLHRFENIERHLMLAARLDQRPHVLGEARSPVAWPGKEEGGADAAIGAHPFAHQADVGPEHLAQARDLVHERNAGREHRVGRVFGHFHRADVHEEERISGADERRVQLFQDPGRLG